MGCVFGKTAAGEGRKAADAAAATEVSRKIEQQPSSLAAAVEASSVPIERREKEGSHSSKGDPAALQPLRERRRSRASLRGYPSVSASGWPSWLTDAVGDAIEGWIPRRADTYEKLDKIGQGTYSNVYKAKDLITGKIVALKKVRFDNLEPESVKFMAREILVLRRLDHPNVIRLEGLVTSRMSSSLYLVFEYMEHDLAGLTATPEIKFTEPQVKCYMKQLFSGLEHCHNHGVLHRDIKGSNLLIGNDGILKIADFGLASFFDPNKRQPMTSRVVTLWYRPPELLLGATTYSVEVDLWSAGCILAELLARKPIMPGRTEVEQMHKIYKLCGSPSEEYWKRLKLPHATIFKPQQSYKRCVKETFKDFPPSSLSLVDMLLAIDPAERGTATAALQSEFFTTEPYACEPSSLPHYPPSKEMDAKLRDEEARRQRGITGKTTGGDGLRKVRIRDRGTRAVPAPEANAELQINLDRRRFITHGNAKSKSEKFPPPHQDGAVGFPLDSSHNGPISFGGADHSFGSSIFDLAKSRGVPSSGPLGNAKANGEPSRRKKAAERIAQFAPSSTFIRSLPSSIALAIDLRRDPTKSRKAKGRQSGSEVFGGAN